MPFACIHVPDFAVEAVVRSTPAADGGNSLRQQGVAVLEGAPPLTRVMAANEKARAAGIEIGMTRLQAESCAGVVLRMRSASEEESAHAALVDCACSFSPVVESSTPETVVLDIGGLEHLFGAPARLARELARRLSRLGMEGNVAVAENPDAAIHAARGFPGATVIPAGKEAERLGSLPVDVLAPAPELLEMLDRWGVRTLRALASLPPVPVAERLGQEGLRLQRLARGEGMRKLVPLLEPLHFCESMELEDAVELLDPLSFLLARLLEQLCERLRSRALAANELRLTLGLEVHQDRQLRGETGEDGPATVHERKLRLPVPMQDSKIFLKLLQLDLRAHPPAAPVRKIRLEAEPARPRQTQEGLFSRRLPQPEKLEVMLARLNSIVGVNAADPEARVGSPEVLDTHRPDAFRIVPFSPHTSPHSSHDEASTSRGRLAHTAMRIFRPPLPLRVELRAGRPSFLLLHGKRYEVAASAGPWRSSGEWWNAEPWSRDEWDVGVRMQHGLALYRIFCEVRSGRWFAEGEYD
jgi:protein ImuB